MGGAVGDERQNAVEHSPDGTGGRRLPGGVRDAEVLTEQLVGAVDQEDLHPTVLVPPDDSGLLTQELLGRLRVEVARGGQTTEELYPAFIRLPAAVQEAASVLQPAGAGQG